MRLIVIITCLITSTIWGQLVTTPQSAANLVQNTLTGPGVTVSNVQFTGNAQAIGRFTGNVTNLGFTSGVILTTGTILNTSGGPHGPNDQTNAGVINGAPGNSQLSNVIGGTSTFDAAILEFDFVPLSDSVKFRYVFGSEEYPEYVGSTFNDVFAFFISGPGIAGIQNMAQLPGGAGIVSINNVNNGFGGTPASNPQYFIDNGTGSPAGTDNNALQYDGFTKTLTAVSKVICGSTYHLKIAIADVGDGIFDSGIFLEANSLTANVSVNIVTSISNNAFNDPTIMAEGCTNGSVTITRVGAQTGTTSLTIPITMSGTATEGVDYSNIPNSITFAPGQTVQVINFSSTADVLVEGQESIIFEFGIADPCGNSQNQTRTLYIKDILPLAVTLADTSVICPGSTVVLDPNVTGGGGTYTYLWSPTGETTETISVSPLATQIYTVTVTESCLNNTASASGTVSIPVYPPIVLVVTNDIVEQCPYVPFDLTVEPSGGAGFYTVQWSQGTTLLGISNLQNVIPSTTTTYTVNVTDQCGVVGTENVLITILSPPLLITTTPKQIVCPGDSTLIGVTATGGWGTYYYDWLHTTESTANVWVNPRETTTYTVNVSDDCQTFYVTGQTIVEVIRPTADFDFSENLLFENIPITITNNSIDAINYEWNFGNGTTSTVVHPNVEYRPPGDYLISLVAINYLGCRDTISKLITITPEWYFYVPNTFTPDDGNFNNVFKMCGTNITKLDIKIFNRWGEIVFKDDQVRFEWDGTYKGVVCQDGVYNYVINYVNILGEEHTALGHVNLIK